MFYLVDALTAPYLRLKGNEVLLVFVVYFPIYDICYIHHWGQEKNIVLCKCYNQRKQTKRNSRLSSDQQQHKPCSSNVFFLNS